MAGASAVGEQKGEGGVMIAMWSFLVGEVVGVRGMRVGVRGGWRGVKRLKGGEVGDHAGCGEVMEGAACGWVGVWA